METAHANARLETFCDGVFAIAMTLLIIEIKVPSPEGIAGTPDVVARASALTAIDICVCPELHRHPHHLGESPQRAQVGAAVVERVYLFQWILTADRLSSSRSRRRCWASFSRRTALLQRWFCITQSWPFRRLAGFCLVTRS